MVKSQANHASCKIFMVSVAILIQFFVAPFGMCSEAGFKGEKLTIERAIATLQQYPQKYNFSTGEVVNAVFQDDNTATIYCNKGNSDALVALFKRSNDGRWFLVQVNAGIGFLRKAVLVK